MAAALREYQADAAFLISLLVAPQVPLRLAGLEVWIDRKEEVLQQPVARLAQDREERVRVKAVEALASFTETTVVISALTPSNVPLPTPLGPMTATSLPVGTR